MASEWPGFAFLQPQKRGNFTAFDASPDGALWDLSCETQPCTYLHRDAARAWQAFRDWLDGTPEQWQRRMVEHGRVSFAEGATINPLMAEMYERMGGVR